MKSSPRFQMALLLTVIYLLIIMVQLVPVVGRSADLERQCGGDCAECGCSPAQSAMKSCCCWQTKTHAGHGKDHESGNKGKGDNSRVLSCGSPCHDENPPTLWDTDEIALMDLSWGQVAHAWRDNLYWSRTDRELSRQDPPPDPPPESSFCRQNAA